MAEPSWALQQALFAAIGTAVSPHSVYDAVPQDAAYPYVTLDSEAVDNADFLSSRMDRRFVYLNVWSAYKGQKEVKEIMAQIDAALHEQPLSLSTGSVVSVRVERKDTIRDVDGETFTGRITLRILTRH